jgi:uncharacterized protein involved in cysteine biosynthesis
MNEELKVTEPMREHLLKAASWLKFLAVLGVIGVVLMVLVSIGLMVFDNRLSDEIPLGGSLGVVYLVVAAIYIYPLVKSFSLIRHTREAFRVENGQPDIEQAAADCHAILKFMGVLTIVLMVVYVLILIGAVIVGVAGMGQLG